MHVAVHTRSHPLNPTCFPDMFAFIYILFTFAPRSSHGTINLLASPPFPDSPSSTYTANRL